MDKLSVIVPVYKVEKYLPQSIESILNQTYKNLEIILVDDGSPDHCGQMCEEYAKKDPRIRVIHKKNEGAPAARNDALAIATGDWLAYVDPDDWLETNAFELAMETAAREQSDIVIFNCCYEMSSGKSTVKQAFLEDFTVTDREFIYQLQLSALHRSFTPGIHKWSQGFPWDKIYRMSRMREQNVLWPSDLQAHDDVVYTIYAFQAARKVSYLNRTLYHYRYNPNSIGNKYTPDRIKIEKDLHRELLRIRETYGFNEEYDQAVYARFVYNMWHDLRRCFFHPENPASFRTKIGTLKECLNEEPFASAFSKIDRSRIDQRPLRLMLLFPKPNAVWFYICYKLMTVKVEIERLFYGGTEKLA